MIVIAAFEILLILGIVYAVFTQVLIPLYRGTLLFPVFRKRQELEQDIKKAKEERDERHLEKEAERIRNQK
ncbi:MAG: hypothetical protein A2231_05925 [Candidatus Firestonebacteria bacterium RIFOXYA2_FULL_40_8]|nr:MAG: hypothetical protein A2231_05925 [Candidatus Firestonebacteria bacterium RIFOXYA2_FULL_40_8]